MQKVQSIPIALKSENEEVNFYFECLIEKNERVEEVMEQNFQIPRNRLFIDGNYHHEYLVFYKL